MSPVTRPRVGGELLDRQAYETPEELLAAVERRFGLLTCDLACSVANAKAPDAFAHEHGNSLEGAWPIEGVLWLNPPFADIEPWARKAAAWRGEYGARLLMLTPASIGSAWFRDHVHGHALVLALAPRIRFVGTRGTDMRDYILSVYGDAAGFDCWKWTTTKKGTKSDV